MNNCSDLSLIVSQYDPRQVFVVIDSALELCPDYKNQNYSNISELVNITSGFPTLCLEAKEMNKTLKTVEQIWNFLFDHHATRKALLINIGGGIICDLGGFAASTYKRGIDYVNIPTTLLSMSDAAWGGKTGFNYHGMKNAIGVIRQPKATLIFPSWLDTLSEQEKLSGYAEIIKCGLLKDSTTFHTILRALEDRDYENGIAVAVEVKQSVVREDPNEQSLRKVLNLGHSVGHAIEELGIRNASGTKYTQGVIPHGYAVLYGLVAMAYLSHILLGLDRRIVTTLSHIMVEYYGRMPFQCKDYKEIINLMYCDKKNEHEGEIRMVLLRHIGEPVTDQIVHEEELMESLEYLFSL